MAKYFNPFGTTPDYGAEVVGGIIQDAPPSSYETYGPKDFWPPPGDKTTRSGQGPDIDPEEEPPSGGGGGGGGYNYADPNVGSAIRDDLIFWFGADWVSGNPSVVTTLKEKRATADDVRRYAVDNGANGPGMKSALDNVDQFLMRNLGPEIARNIPDATKDNWIATGEYKSADDMWPAIQNMNNIGWDTLVDPETGGPATQEFFTAWTDMTGMSDLTWTAENKMIDIVKQYGTGDDALTMWEEWTRTTDSAATGNYGSDQRALITDTFQTLLRRNPTEEELSKSGGYWNLDESALTEEIRGTEEYQTKYAHKAPWQTETEYMALRRTVKSGLRQYLGVNVGAADAALTGTSADAASVDGIIDDINSGKYTFSELEKSWKWNEDATVLEGTLGPVVEEAFGTDFTEQEYYNLAAYEAGQPVKGAGALKVRAIEARNRVEYREVWRRYNEGDPTPADYDYVMNNFVSPAEYARTQAAQNQADAKLPQINKLLSRVYGDTISKSELTNMITGGPGSGRLRAMIDQATRADEYRQTHKLHYGEEPTPEDYAKYLNLTGPQELKWKLNVAEDIAEFGPDIQETWQEVYDTELSEDQLRTMLGDMSGSGELKHKYKEAEEQIEEEEKEHAAGFTTPQAAHQYGTSKQGGFKTNMPGLEDLAGE